MRIDATNAIELISQYDIVADGSDNFATRYLVSDACYLAKRPLVFAALGPFDGYLTTFKPHDKDSDGTPYPSYRCLFPQAPSEENVFNCSEVGVLGAVAGVMGTLQAVEVLKEITGAGDSMAGNLTIYDALGGRFQNITLKWDPNNPLSGKAPTITDLSIHADRLGGRKHCRRRFAPRRCAASKARSTASAAALSRHNPQRLRCSRSSE